MYGLGSSFGPKGGFFAAFAATLQVLEEIDLTLPGVTCPYGALHVKPKGLAVLI